MNDITKDEAMDLLYKYSDYFEAITGEKIRVLRIVFFENEEDYKNIKIVDIEGNVSVPKKIPTVKTILTHSSGIGSYQEKMKNMTAQDKRTLDSSVGFYLNLGLDFEPDSIQKYSGVAAFDVLTKIVEIVSKTDFLEFLKKEIFEPCGMCDTTFIPSQEQWERMIEMHDRVNGENAVFKMPDNCVFSDVPCTHYLDEIKRDAEYEIETEIEDDIPSEPQSEIEYGMTMLLRLENFIGEVK